VASAGVWLTFYIGRINIGQGAYALVGGYVSAILMTQGGVQLLATLPLAGLFCAAGLGGDRPADPAAPGGLLSPWSPWS
jgi:branched-subunit amino acid ABC-type transport system permease component